MERNQLTLFLLDLPWEVRTQNCPLEARQLTGIGHTATVFGATGQLGRYIVNRLGMFPVDSSVGVRTADLITFLQPAKDVPLSSPSAKK
jgi:hypothetical protein